jgi:hypothetical protein
MSQTIFFFLHLIGFGLLTPVLIGGWVLEFRFRSEPDLQQKLYLVRLIRSLGLLSPAATLLLLATGIGNIYYRYGEVMHEWFTEGWLVAKIMLFGVLLVNGTLFGPPMSRKRARLLSAMGEGSAPADAESLVAHLNRQLMWFYAVQSILLLAILALSTFGT